MEIMNWLKFLIKNVLYVENDSIYAFRKCGHLCLCQNCYNSGITKCIVCKT